MIKVVTTSTIIFVASLSLLQLKIANAFSATTPIDKNVDWKNAAFEASEILSKAKSVLFVTGAGISAEAGLPTYRGTGGLYNSGNTKDGIPIEECLSGYMYKHRPDITWQYILEIEKSCRNVQPSKAHYLVAKMEKYFDSKDVTVITQNIDGLHTMAGSTNVLELHGELYKLYCPTCGHKETVPSYQGIEEKGIIPPTCPECHGIGSMENSNTPTTTSSSSSSSTSILRPNVVLFDEYLGDETISRYETLMKGHSFGTISSTKDDKPFDVCFSIGTTNLFQYVMAASLSGKVNIEINPSVTSISNIVDIRIPTGASESLGYIFDELGWER